MIKIYVSKQSNYPINSADIKKKLKDFFLDSGIVSDTSVDISIVGEKKMLELARDYLGEENILHNVLSFPATEVRKPFVYPADGIMRLGEIIVCYPKVVEESKKEGRLINEKLYELVEHGARHLMGEHHE